MTTTSHLTDTIEWGIASDAHPRVSQYVSRETAENGLATAVANGWIQQGFVVTRTTSTTAWQLADDDTSDATDTEWAFGHPWSAHLRGDYQTRAEALAALRKTRKGGRLYTRTYRATPWAPPADSTQPADAAPPPHAAALATDLIDYLDAVEVALDHLADDSETPRELLRRPSASPRAEQILPPTPRPHGPTT